MAITIIKQPAEFFNCTNPVIFEFTTDSVVGNFDDYIADIFIKSEYATKTAVIRNVFPNTISKVFSVDTGEFLKSLQLNNFEFEFNRQKNLAIEKFSIEIRIRDGSIPSAEIFSFDDYYFDNLIFTDGLGSIDTSISIAYSILGELLDFDSIKNYLISDKLTFLTPKTIEVCEGFDNYVSIFNNESVGNKVDVKGNAGDIIEEKGVGTYLFSESQVELISSLTEVTCTNQNEFKRIFAYPFRSDCEVVVQFRFFNRMGGFSYFYAVLDSQEASRSKVAFYNRNYSNENENKPSAVQSDSDYDNKLDFKGSKIIALKELFDLLLRSPKVEMNLKQYNGNDFFMECELTGKSADVYTYFDYSLTAKIKNKNTFRL